MIKRYFKKKIMLNKGKVNNLILITSNIDPNNKIRIKIMLNKVILKFEIFF